MERFATKVAVLADQHWRARILSQISELARLADQLEIIAYKRHSQPQAALSKPKNFPREGRSNFQSCAGPADPALAPSSTPSLADFGARICESWSVGGRTGGPP